MDSFAEKFNIFDIFTTLIPGIIILTLFGISLSFRYYRIWLCFDNEKYVIFFIFSYLCGVLFQELGTVLDNLFLYKLLYGGKPREIFLLEDKYKKIFEDKLSYKQALKVKDYLLDSFFKEQYKETDIDEKELNSVVFAYCLNMSEMNGLTSKSDKMIAMSEMSRSLFLGCVITILLNVHMIFKYSYYYKFYYVEIGILIIASIILLCRKKRYEKFRIRILLREFLINIKGDDNIQKQEGK